MFIAVTAEEVAAVHEVLEAYYRAIVDGTADRIFPNPMHKWRYYKGGMTIGRMKEKVEDLDEYWDDPAQIGYVNRTARDGKNDADKGPGLSRLPAEAMVSLWQELDSVLYRFYPEGYVEPPPDAEPVAGDN